MQTVRCPITKRLPFARERINKMHGFVVIRCDYRKIVNMIRKYHNLTNCRQIMAPRGRATQQSRDISKTNQAKQPALSSPSR